MKTNDEIKKLIDEISRRRDEHFELANMADTSSGEDHFIKLAESDIDWIEALGWVLSDS